MQLASCTRGVAVSCSTYGTVEARPGLHHRLSSAQVPSLLKQSSHEQFVASAASVVSQLGGW